MPSHTEKVIIKQYSFDIEFILADFDGQREDDELEGHSEKLLVCQV